VTRGPFALDAIVAELNRRLEGATGEDSEWLDDEEFAEYAELRRRGLPVEAPDCRRLLARARARRKRDEAKPNGLWRVDIEEGRPTVVPRMSDEELKEWGQRVHDASPRGRLVERGDGNSSWSPPTAPKRALGA